MAVRTFEEGVPWWRGRAGRIARQPISRPKLKCILLLILLSLRIIYSVSQRYSRIEILISASTGNIREPIFTPPLGLSFLLILLISSSARAQGVQYL